MENQNSTKKANSSLTTYRFNRHDNTWIFHYIDNDVKEPLPVKFQLSRDLWGTTPNLLDKKFHWAIDAAVFLKDENGEWEKDPTSKIPLSIPNLFVDEDPHKVLDADHMHQLYACLVREAQDSWIQKLADIWKGDVCRKSSAWEFNLEVCNEDKEE